jgi:hypothetical protein
MSDSIPEKRTADYILNQHLNLKPYCTVVMSMSEQGTVLDMSENMRLPDLLYMQLILKEHISKIYYSLKKKLND